jgi:hypothetical protein
MSIFFDVVLGGEIGLVCGGAYILLRRIERIVTRIERTVTQKPAPTPPVLVFNESTVATVKATAPVQSSTGDDNHVTCVSCNRTVARYRLGTVGPICANCAPFSDTGSE